jgi:hypothetical protein
MHTFQEGLPVRLIATARQDLRTCCDDEWIADVVTRNQEGFDHFPVVASSGVPDRIIGLIELVGWDQGKAAAGRVSDRMSPLCEDNLIGADASILSFVKSADTNPCRLVVSGARIEGLVSLSDLQKLPVRAALFALITQLEMTMAEAIRRECRGSARWKERLSPGRLEKVEAKQRAARRDDNWVDDLLFTEFADKKTIIRKAAILPDGKTQFDEAMREAEGLRNLLAHANDYAESRAAAAKVCSTARTIEHWIERLTAWSAANAMAKG